ncbi:mechanosensitive ion channel [Peptacetobacter hominis]|uniref:Mechanosensitive ion channel n=1 Tax=Peptacetobacter hominis TaxID=2743610 RepID=A0A544QSZ0_9FIRM|nr:mechanosensitive ion channel domain-containing protein [Peptacetobacter hominis]TQQ83150.1 mechanosensitive ion channel [Peptacetobacter hominis]
MGETVKSSMAFQSIINSAAEKIPSLIYAIILFLIGFAIAKACKKVVSKILCKYTSGKGITNFIVYGVYISIIVVAALNSLDMIGIKTTSVVTIIGAAGFSVGLAFKEVLSNLASGIIILFFRPFNIGDYIQGGENNIEGTVSDIQIFSTVLKTPDNKTITVPNFQITANDIINYTHQDMRRVDFVFNVAYDTDINLLKSIVNDVFENDSRVLKDPRPLIGINSMGNNTIEFISKPWVKTEEYWDAYYDLMEKIKYRFDENNIVLPYTYNVPAKK